MTSLAIGNDIVDLAEPGAAGKARDRRFMDRVFTAEERACILGALSPALAVWKTWAAKETAYKIASKVRGKVVFAHRAFEVEPGAAGTAGGWGRVRFDGLDIRVRWETARDYVHCVGQLIQHRPGDAAASPHEPRPVHSAIVHHGQLLSGTLSAAERASVHSTPSARARLVARRLFERLGLQGVEVLRHWRERGWGPPVAAIGGEMLPGFDVSLSHDGRFVAAAVAGAAQGSGFLRRGRGDPITGVR
ncbi:MAG TPA: 4'-phosphopantetheinyl transferase superfamily protein [Vicinamibacterales bacterium]|nr:4'-phosphopantetheinyl transferase superfamily protein [Vicinamibacterales bacterium]HPW21808.1 4'-phosphopantetheinyl transferase superfamily protein [Vicinamibacterales bacterium]